MTMPQSSGNDLSILGFKIDIKNAESKIDSLMTKFKGLEDETEEAKKKIEETTSELADFADLQDKIGKIASGFGTIVRAFDKMPKELDLFESIKKLGHSAKSIEKFSDATQGLEKIAQASTALVDLEQNVNRSATAFDTFATNVGKAVAAVNKLSVASVGLFSSPEETKKVSDEIKKQVSLYQDQFEGLRKTAQKIATAINKPGDIYHYEEQMLQIYKLQGVIKGLHEQAKSLGTIDTSAFKTIGAEAEAMLHAAEKRKEILKSPDKYKKAPADVPPPVEGEIKPAIDPLMIDADKAKTNVEFFDNIANALSKISKIDTGNIKAVNAEIKKLYDSMNPLGVDEKTGGRTSFSAMADNITRINNQLAEATQKAVNASDELNKLMMESAQVFSSSVDKIIDNLSIKVLNDGYKQAEDNLRKTFAGLGTEAKKAFLGPLQTWEVMPKLKIDKDVLSSVQDGLQKIIDGSATYMEEHPIVFIPRFPDMTNKDFEARIKTLQTRFSEMIGEGLTIKVSTADVSKAKITGKTELQKRLKESLGNLTLPINKVDLSGIEASIGEELAALAARLQNEKTKIAIPVSKLDFSKVKITDEGIEKIKTKLANTLFIPVSISKIEILKNAEGKIEGLTALQNEIDNSVSLKIKARVDTSALQLHDLDKIIDKVNTSVLSHLPLKVTFNDTQIQQAIAAALKDVVAISINPTITLTNSEIKNEEALRAKINAVLSTGINISISSADVSNAVVTGQDKLAEKLKTENGLTVPIANVDMTDAFNGKKIGLGKLRAALKAYEGLTVSVKHIDASETEASFASLGTRLVEKIASIQAELDNKPLTIHANIDILEQLSAADNIKSQMASVSEEIEKTLTDSAKLQKEQKTRTKFNPYSNAFEMGGWFQDSSTHYMPDSAFDWTQSDDIMPQTEKVKAAIDLQINNLKEKLEGLGKELGNAEADSPVTRLFNALKAQIEAMPPLPAPKIADFDEKAFDSLNTRINDLQNKLASLPLTLSVKTNIEEIDSTRLTEKVASMQSELNNKPLTIKAKIDLSERISSSDYRAQLDPQVAELESKRDEIINDLSNINNYQKYFKETKPKELNLDSSRWFQDISMKYMPDNNFKWKKIKDVTSQAEELKHAIISRMKEINNEISKSREEFDQALASGPITHLFYTFRKQIEAMPPLPAPKIKDFSDKTFASLNTRIDNLQNKLASLQLTLSIKANTEELDGIKTKIETLRKTLEEKPLLIQPASAHLDKTISVISDAVKNLQKDLDSYPITISVYDNDAHNIKVVKDSILKTLNATRKTVTANPVNINTGEDKTTNAKNTADAIIKAVNSLISDVASKPVLIITKEDEKQNVAATTASILKAHEANMSLVASKPILVKTVDNVAENITALGSKLSEKVASIQTELNAKPLIIHTKIDLLDTLKEASIETQMQSVSQKLEQAMSDLSELNRKQKAYAKFNASDNLLGQSGTFQGLDTKHMFDLSELNRKKKEYANLSPFGNLLNMGRMFQDLSAKYMPESTFDWIKSDDIMQQTEKLKAAIDLQINNLKGKFEGLGKELQSAEAANPLTKLFADLNAIFTTANIIKSAHFCNNAFKELAGGVNSLNAAFTRFEKRHEVIKKGADAMNDAAKTAKEYAESLRSLAESMGAMKVFARFVKKIDEASGKQKGIRDIAELPSADVLSNSFDNEKKELMKAEAAQIAEKTKPKALEKRAEKERELKEKADEEYNKLVAKSLKEQSNNDFSSDLRKEFASQWIHRKNANGEVDKDDLLDVRDPDNLGSVAKRAKALAEENHKLAESMKEGSRSSVQWQNQMRNSTDDIDRLGKGIAGAAEEGKKLNVMSRHISMIAREVGNVDSSKLDELKIKAGSTRHALVDMFQAAGFYISTRSLINFFKTAAQSAVQFGYEIRKIQSLATTFDFKALDENLKNIDARLGNITHNAKALYWAYSSGVRGTERELAKFTESMSKTALTIGADVMPTLDAATTLMNAYGLSAKNAGEVSDLLFTIVKEGKASAKELTGSLGNVVATASSLGLTLDELGAASATLTKTMKTNKALTYLNNILGKIVNPSSDVKEELAKLGLEMNVSMIRAKGFTKVMQELHDATRGDISLIAKLFPDLRGQRAAVTLLSTQYSEFMNQLAKFRNKEGNMEEALGIITDSPEAQLKGLANTFTILKMEAGEAITTLFTLNGVLADLGGIINSIGSTGRDFLGKSLAIGSLLAVTSLAGKAMTMVKFASANAQIQQNLLDVEAPKQKAADAMETSKQLLLLRQLTDAETAATIARRESESQVLSGIRVQKEENDALRASLKLQMEIAKAKATSAGIQFNETQNKKLDEIARAQYEVNYLSAFLKQETLSDDTTDLQRRNRKIQTSNKTYTDYMVGVRNDLAKEKAGRKMLLSESEFERVNKAIDEIVENMQLAILDRPGLDPIESFQLSAEATKQLNFLFKEFDEDTRTDLASKMLAGGMLRKYNTEMSLGAAKDKTDSLEANIRSFLTPELKKAQSRLNMLQADFGMSRDVTGKELEQSAVKEQLELRQRQLEADATAASLNAQEKLESERLGVESNKQLLQTNKALTDEVKRAADILKENFQNQQANSEARLKAAGAEGKTKSNKAVNEATEQYNIMLKEILGLNNEQIESQIKNLELIKKSNEDEKDKLDTEIKQLNVQTQQMAIQKKKAQFAKLELVIKQQQNRIDTLRALQQTARLNTATQQPSIWDRSGQVMAGMQGSKMMNFAAYLPGGSMMLKGLGRTLSATILGVTKGMRSFIVQNKILRSVILSNALAMRILKGTTQQATVALLEMKAAEALKTAAGKAISGVSLGIIGVISAITMAIFALNDYAGSRNPMQGVADWMVGIKKLKERQEAAEEEQQAYADLISLNKTSRMDAEKYNESLKARASILNDTLVGLRKANATAERINIKEEEYARAKLRSAEIEVLLSRMNPKKLQEKVTKKMLEIDAKIKQAHATIDATIVKYNDRRQVIQRGDYAKNQMARKALRDAYDEKERLSRVNLTTLNSEDIGTLRARELQMKMEDDREDMLYNEISLERRIEIAQRKENDARERTLSLSKDGKSVAEMTEDYASAAYRAEVASIEARRKVTQFKKDSDEYKDAEKNAEKAADAAQKAREKYNNYITAVRENQKDEIKYYLEQRKLNEQLLRQRAALRHAEAERKAIYNSGDPAIRIDLEAAYREAVEHLAKLPQKAIDLAVKFAQDDLNKANNRVKIEQDKFNNNPNDATQKRLLQMAIENQTKMKAALEIAGKAVPTTEENTKAITELNKTINALIKDFEALYGRLIKLMESFGTRTGDIEKNRWDRILGGKDGGLLSAGSSWMAYLFRSMFKNGINDGKLYRDMLNAGGSGNYIRNTQKQLGILNGALSVTDVQKQLDASMIELSNLQDWLEMAKRDDELYKLKEEETSTAKKLLEVKKDELENALKHYNSDSTKQIYRDQLNELDKDGQEKLDKELLDRRKQALAAYQHSKKQYNDAVASGASAAELDKLKNEMEQNREKHLSARDASETFHTMKNELERIRALQGEVMLNEYNLSLKQKELDEAKANASAADIYRIEDEIAAAEKQIRKNKEALKLAQFVENNPELKKQFESNLKNAYKINADALTPQQIAMQKTWDYNRAVWAKNARNAKYNSYKDVEAAEKNLEQTKADYASRLEEEKGFEILRKENIRIINEAQKYAAEAKANAANMEMKLTESRKRLNEAIPWYSGMNDEEKARYRDELTKRLSGDAFEQLPTRVRQARLDYQNAVASGKTTPEELKMKRDIWEKLADRMLNDKSRKEALDDEAKAREEMNKANQALAEAEDNLQDALLRQQQDIDAARLATMNGTQSSDVKKAELALQQAMNRAKVYAEYSGKDIETAMKEMLAAQKFAREDWIMRNGTLRQRSQLRYSQFSSKADAEMAEYNKQMAIAKDEKKNEKERTEALEKANAALDKLKATQADGIAVMERLVEAERQARKEAFDLAMSLNKFTSTAQQAVMAYSTEATSLRFRTWEKPIQMPEASTSLEENIKLVRENTEYVLSQATEAAAQATKALGDKFAEAQNQTVKASESFRNSVEQFGNAVKTFNGNINRSGIEVITPF